MVRSHNKPPNWQRAYFVGRVGDAAPETVRAYVDAQGTGKHAREAALTSESGRSPDFHLAHRRRLYVCLVSRHVQEGKCADDMYTAKRSTAKLPIKCTIVVPAAEEVVARQLQ